MPTVELDKKDLIHFIGKKVPDDELRERTPMIGTDLDALDDKTMTVEIFPDRPDMLSEEGLGRALQGFLGVKKGLVKYNVKKGQYKAVVSKEMADIRPYVGFVVLKGIKFTDTFIKSHMQLQDKLATTHCRKRKKADMGIFDLSKIKFPITYRSLGPEEKFQPLLMDKEMTVKDILTKMPQGKEYAHLLKHLKRYPGNVDADGKIMCMIPIVQVDYSKITENTKDVLVGVAGKDWKTMIQLLNILICNWAERGAEIYSVEMEYPYDTPLGKKFTLPQLEPAKKTLDVAYVNKLLGLQLKPKETAELLERMRFGATASGNKIEVLVPAYRTDILHDADLVEDIAIAYGYDKLKPEIPKVATIGQEDPKSIFRKKVAETATGLGLLECVNYHLTNKHLLYQKMGLTEDENTDKALVRAINAVNTDYNIVRNSLMPMLMKVLSENKHYEYPQKLFEIGETMYVDENKKIVESLNLSIVSAHNASDFTEIRSMTEALFKAIGHPVEFKTAENPSLIHGRACNIMYKDKKIGMIGEIHPRVLNNFEVEQPVSAMEVVLDTLL